VRKGVEEFLSSRCACGFPGEEALAAVDRAALRWLEGNRGLPPALRAHRHGFGFGEAATGRSLAFGFAALTTLGLVLEVLVVEEVLFSRCKYEIRTAIYTL
jgi:hypothetical protein